MSPSFCPHCGAPIQRKPLALRRVPEDAGAVRQFAFGGDVASGATWQEHRRPARPADVASDVAAPALQAFVTGLAAAGVALLLVVGLRLPWLAVPAAGAVAFALSWLALLAEHRRALWQVERFQYEPANAPETTPAPEPARTTRLAVTLGNVHHERELPLEPDALLRLARALAGGERPFSERELVRAGLLSGRAQYEQTRDVFLKVGWLRWRNPNDRRQGADWTAPGRAGLRALADGRATVDELVA